MIIHGPGAFDFIANADAKTLLKALERAQCKICDGSGESDDASLGDISFNTWECQNCGGKGWDRQAVREIIATV